VKIHYVLHPISFHLPSSHHFHVTSRPKPDKTTPFVKTIRVVVADDSPTALRSLCDFLDFAGGFEIVGTASDGLNAMQLASAHKPDLVLLDLSMPRVNGLEAALQIRLSSPDLRVIIFSELYGLGLAEECRRHGADAFVHKSNLAERLVPEIQRLFASGDRGPGAGDN
jgi:DNA-binding NarL/FixJ family response regulator